MSTWTKPSDRGVGLTEAIVSCCALRSGRSIPRLVSGPVVPVTISTDWTVMRAVGLAGILLLKDESDRLRRRRQGDRIADRVAGKLAGQGRGRRPFDIDQAVRHQPQRRRIDIGFAMAKCRYRLTRRRQWHEL